MVHGRQVHYGAPHRREQGTHIGYTKNHGLVSASSLSSTSAPAANQHTNTEIRNTYRLQTVALEQHVWYRLGNIRFEQFVGKGPHSHQ
jgi:hypothetical protein